MAKRRVKLGGILITKREDELLFRFGNISRGYSIPCRFCGGLSADHDFEDQRSLDKKERKIVVEGGDVQQKGYRTTLHNCANNIGYAPRNVRQWERAEIADSRGEWD